MGIGIPEVDKRDIIWIHAVSVGEVVASKPFVSLFQKELTGYQIVFSTTTHTGKKMAQKVIEGNSHLFYLPFDFPFVVKKVMGRISPLVIALVETELWPNLLRYAEYFKIPVVVLNGRISPSSFKGYMKIRPFFVRILNKVTVFCMQTEEDKRRLIELGIKADKIKVTGNMKFDNYDDSGLLPKGELMKRWNISGREPVIVAGSTHPGEESILLKNFRKIEERFPKALLIIVPRHPERAKEIETLMREEGYSYLKRTEMNNSQIDEKILLVDTIGELLQIYALADVVFVGGSLIPKGGHNPLEPASLAKPIITGPHTFNFAEIMDILKKNNAIIKIKNGEQLGKVLRELLSNPREREQYGINARRVIQSYQGASRKNLEVIEKIVEKV